MFRNKITYPIKQGLAMFQIEAKVRRTKMICSVFLNTLHTFFPKNCDQKLGCVAYSRITKLVKTRKHKEDGGGGQAFVPWCECALTFLMVNVLSKLSLFLPRAKQSQLQNANVR
jgi:hypothetical protein